MSAVPNASLRSPPVPDSDRIWLSSGYTWDFDEHLRLSFGYAHLFAVKGNVALSNASLGTLTGSYSSSADIVSTSFTYKF